ncbi:hypothetical protein K488DRAFT_91880 [Vararia minispora EC-137]|uniref:Uncharacterized protein n=1 Tax=Vararia minispora EC-137 TaxID=1314806 RepID=A0ACB8Q5C3_9AGAM|nr:hypothetical protein K488DRAFT_91880 [Vararia minispora EC-137]
MSSFVDSTLSCYCNVCADIEELVSHSSLYIDGKGSEWYELFCALRLYAFGSPVRRTSSNAYAPPPPGCIRLRLFSADRRRRGRVLDQVDFHLEPNGGLDVDAVRAYWGIKLLRPCDTATEMVFAPARDDQWSALVLHNLTHGKFNKLNVIYVPSAEDEFNPSKGTRPAALAASFCMTQTVACVTVDWDLGFLNIEAAPITLFTNYSDVDQSVFAAKTHRTGTPNTNLSYSSVANENLPDFSADLVPAGFQLAPNGQYLIAQTHTGEHDVVWYWTRDLHPVFWWYSGAFMTRFLFEILPTPTSLHLTKGN